MRVLYVTHYADMYGANLSMLDLILELKSNYNVTPIVLVNKHGKLINELKKNNIPYITKKYYTCSINIESGNIKFRRIVKRFIRLFTYPYVAYSIKAAYKHIDLVHSNSSMTDLGYYISRKLQCPHVWHIREYGLEDYSLIQIDNREKIKERYEKSKYVIAISESIEKMIRAINNNLMIEMIYDGVRIPIEYTKRYTNKKVINFCIVGLISEKKNQMEAVMATKLLLENGVNNFCVNIVGGDSKGEKQRIINFIKKYHLEKNINIVEYQENVYSYLRNMDVGIVTSNKEAFGRVTIEYMSNYMPVVGANTGGTKELILNGKNGFLYQSGNIIDLADKMNEFISNPDLLREMGSIARTFSLEFSDQKNANAVYDVYKRVLIFCEEKCKQQKNNN